MNELDPPPSVLELVKENPAADAQWKQWLNNLYEWAKSNMNKDFFTEVSLGNVAGHAAVVIQGHNDDVDAGAEEDIWEPGGTFPYLTAASTIRIAAGGNAADTAAGTGAQAIFVWGLDADYNEINDTIVTNGASASTATTNTYLRVLGAKATVVGSGGVNAGTIVIEAVTGTVTQAQIDPGEGVSHSSFYTVPANKKALILGGDFSAVKGSGGGGPGSGTAGIKAVGYLRKYNEASNNNYESWVQAARNNIVEGGSNPATIKLIVSQDVMDEKADFRVAASSDTSNMEVIARVYIVLVDK